MSGVRWVRADLHNHLGRVQDIDDVGFDYIADHSARVMGPGGLVGVVNYWGRVPRLHYDTFAGLKGRYERLELGNAIILPGKDNLGFVRGDEIEFLYDGRKVHLLVLGAMPGTKFTTHMSLDDTLSQAEDSGGKIFLDHPFALQGLLNYLIHDPDKLYEVMRRVHGMEVHNGEGIIPAPPKLLLFANGRTQRFFDKLRKIKGYEDLIALVSSDGHSLDEVGSSYFYLRMPKTYEAYDALSFINLLASRMVFNNYSSDLPTPKKTISWVGTYNHAKDVARELGIVGTRSKIFRN